ncbi:hypothetical protein [Chitinophaga sp. MD30]|uniref:hypothetical protein n=1 Tax=Chitinophaga sp. MD30 TaxID=2033437 RepID=UPI0012FE472B|nr:hypothetical protein [Chitinophaga sp. MD30]
MKKYKDSRKDFYKRRFPCGVMGAGEPIVGSKKKTIKIDSLFVIPLGFRSAILSLQVFT